jgi:pyridoxal phosphate enzyme (YggS family)
MRPNTQISQTQIDIENRILRACKQASRKRSDVKLIAVSKRQEADRIQASLEAGFRCFGENQVQEALARWLPLTSIYPDLELHLIGALQSNKAADAVRLFDVIHTIDRDKIAKAVSVEMKKQNKQLSCFIQVNTGHESQKSGIVPEEAVEFAQICAHDYGLIVEGFMCIPPIEEDASPHFAFLNKLASQAGLASLSMGMSADFEDAIRLGATHIRIGSAFFGNRAY